MGLEALIFDCDGVLADTERDGHRPAFNQAFAAKGMDVSWDVPLYGELVQVAGGKERMRAYFERYGWPADVANRDALIAELHELKTRFFMERVVQGQMPLRAGVARIVDLAIEAGVHLAVCSTSNERSVRAVVHHLLGPEREARFAGIFAGDVVPAKKPDPAVYQLAATRLDLQPSRCVVIEDSRNGLLAAKAAGMNCIVTTSSYTTHECFDEADAVVSELGDEPNVQVDLNRMRGLVCQ